MLTITLEHDQGDLSHDVKVTSQNIEFGPDNYERQAIIIMTGPELYDYPDKVLIKEAVCDQIGKEEFVWVNGDEV